MPDGKVTRFLKRSWAFWANILVRVTDANSQSLISLPLSFPTLSPIFKYSKPEGSSKHHFSIKHILITSTYMTSPSFISIPPQQHIFCICLIPSHIFNLAPWAALAMVFLESSAPWKELLRWVRCTSSNVFCTLYVLNKWLLTE